MKHRLEKTPNLYIKQGTTESPRRARSSAGVATLEGIAYRQDRDPLIGHFYARLVHIGETSSAGGSAAISLQLAFQKLRILGFSLGRLKNRHPPTHPPPQHRFFQSRSAARREECAFPLMSAKALASAGALLYHLHDRRDKKDHPKKSSSFLQCIRERFKASDRATAPRLKIKSSVCRQRTTSDFPRARRAYNGRVLRQRHLLLASFRCSTCNDSLRLGIRTG